MCFFLLLLPFAFHSVGQSGSRVDGNEAICKANGVERHVYCISWVSERWFKICSIRMRDSLQQNHNRTHPSPSCRQLGFLMQITVRFQMGNSLFSTAEWRKKKTFFFCHKERVIVFKNVNNTLIETFLMEMRGSI